MRDKFVSCQPKDKTSGFDFTCKVSQLCSWVGEEKLLQVNKEGGRQGMTRASSMLPHTRGRVRAVCFFCCPLGESF